MRTKGDGGVLKFVGVKMSFYVSKLDVWVWMEHPFTIFAHAANKNSIREGAKVKSGLRLLLAAIAVVVTRPVPGWSL